MQSYMHDSDIESEERSFIKRMRRRHPSRSSDCSVLLEEILKGKKLEHRKEAAGIFGSKECKCGLNKLKTLAARLEQSIPLPEEDEWFVSSDSETLLDRVLWAIARMDNPASHEVMKAMLRSKNRCVRADVLEMMAFEKKTFEAKLILPFISDKRHPCEILSALYAVQYRSNLSKPGTAAQRRMVSMLKHEHPNVRIFAIEALSFHPSNRDLIESFKNDPDKWIRKAVAEGLHMMDVLA